jgi:hypothetical protein
MEENRADCSFWSWVIMTETYDPLEDEDKKEEDEFEEN